MAYSGLETIFQNEGPLSGAATAGQREGLAQVADLQNMATNQLAYENAQVMNPLNQQYRRGEIAQQTPILDKLTSEAALKKGTLQSDINVGNSKNESQITTDQVTKVSNMGRMAGELGVMLSSIPPGLQRTQAATQYMIANGIDPQSKAGQYVLNNDPQALIEISDKIAKRKDAYIQAMGTAEKSKESHIEGIKAQKEADRKLEEYRQSHGHTSYQARHSAGISFEQKLMNEGDPIKRVTMLLDAAKIAEQQDNPDLAISYRARAQDLENIARLKASQGNQKPGSVDIQGATGLQTVPVPPVMPETKNTKALSPQDQQAIDWAIANPNDPRAKRILQLHGR